MSDVLRTVGGGRSRPLTQFDQAAIAVPPSATGLMRTVFASSCPLLDSVDVHTVNRVLAQVNTLMSFHSA